MSFPLNFLPGLPPTTALTRTAQEFPTAPAANASLLPAQAFAGSPLQSSPLANPSFIQIFSMLMQLFSTLMGSGAQNLSTSVPLSPTGSSNGFLPQTLPAPQHATQRTSLLQAFSALPAFSTPAQTPPQPAPEPTSPVPITVPQPAQTLPTPQVIQYPVPTPTPAPVPQPQPIQYISAIPAPAPAPIPQAQATQPVATKPTQTTVQPPVTQTTTTTGTATNTVTPLTTPVTPQTTTPQPQPASTQGLFQEATTLLNNAPLKDSDLDVMLTQSGRQQYDKTVNTVFGFNLEGNIIKSGPFTGKHINSVNTIDLVNTGQLKDDWNLADLEKEFAGKYGVIGKGLTNLQTTVSKNTNWHSTPYHLGQAQKYLDEARKLEKYAKDYYVDNSSLNQVIIQLRERASKHYRIAKTTVSPLVVDLAGTGDVKLTDLQNGVKFDINGTGEKTQVAWTEARGKDTAAWLTLDQNGNGTIDNGKELFGNQNGAANGFDELKKYDLNQDGAIDAKDDVYSRLRFWQDMNHDGVSQADEMKTLSDSGVEKINLSYAESNQVDANGNELRQQSTFVRTDAKAQEIAQQKGVSFQQAKSGLSVDAWLLSQS